MKPGAMLGSPLDYAILVIYFGGILAFGSFFARFTRSTDDFFFGNRRFSWWLIAFSYIATTIGSYSFIKYAEVGFKYGTSSTMSYLNDWIFTSFFFLGWLPIIYYSKVSSIPEYFERRFDGRSRMMATATILLYMIGYIGINLFTMGIALNSMLGVDPFWSAVVVAVVCSLYVAAGGQTAVIMTDLIQGVVLLIAGFAIFILGLGVLGGWEGFWSGLPVLHRLPFAKFNEPGGFNTVGVFWQDGIANTFTVYLINQAFILRFLSLKTEREARKTFIFLLLILLPLASLATANAGWIGRSMVSAGLLPEGSDPNRIFVLVAEKVTREGGFGFIMAALLAALMTTIDSLLNAVSVVFVNDLYRPYLHKGASDRHYLRVARSVSLVAAFVGILLVPLYASFQSIYVAHGAFTATVTPPLLVTALLGCFWRRFTPTAAFATLVGGSAMVGLSLAFPWLISPFDHGVDPSGYTYMRALYGLVVSGVIAVGMTYFTRPKPLSEIEGLVVGTLRKAKEKYKGGPLNEEKGGKVRGKLSVSEATSGLSVSPRMLQILKARPGDLVYVEDARRWLGGLRSVHTKITQTHSEGDETLYIHPSLVTQGELILGRPHRVEKIF